MSEERLEYHVIIVGGGPAGLASAIKLKQRQPDKSVCLIEKGASIGSHILSGAVLQTEALTELLPQWQTQGAPVTVKVQQEQFSFLTATTSLSVPGWLLPHELTNHGNHIISLSALCRWLAEQAEALGVDIFTGTTAAECLFENEVVVGIKTGAMGIDKDGTPKSNYMPGFDIFCQYLLVAEGARGFLTQQLIKHYQLQPPNCPQSYGLGIKELWEVAAEQHQPGLVQHTAGWPLDKRTYGGSFIYHLDQNKVAVGFVTALDYQNPQLSPFDELQRFKTHPRIQPLFAGGRRLCYGARVLNEGGYASLPQPSFPGGALIGCAAGLLNVAKIKGVHNALRSGMLAADAIHGATGPHDLSHFDALLRQSVITQELKRSRNFRHYFRFGLTAGTLLAGLDLKLFRGHLPFTLKPRHRDRDAFAQSTRPPQPCPPPTVDNQLTFNRLDSLFLANINSVDDQPNHLIINDLSRFTAISCQRFGAAETRYCPAAVYEYPVATESGPQLTINAANCVHCKACDIKDPSDTLRWHLPEGGSGPNYTEM